MCQRNTRGKKKRVMGGERRKKKKESYEEFLSLRCTVCSDLRQGDGPLKVGLMMEGLVMEVV